jgi:hypothetical protein
MNTILLNQLGISVLAITFCLGDFPFEEKNELRKTLQFSDPAAPKRLELDNLNGAIDVQGYGGREVQLIVYQTFRGRSKDKIQEAREKVTSKFLRKRTPSGFTSMRPIGNAMVR